MQNLVDSNIFISKEYLEACDYLNLARLENFSPINTSYLWVELLQNPNIFDEET